jgi:hypothetical protein
MPEETPLDGLSLQVLHAMAHAVAGAQPSGGDANLAAPSKPRRQSRRDRLSSSLPPEWRRVRQDLLAALCELRIEQEPAPYSPDLSRAALFARPSRADVPPPPRGAAPDPLDRSEDAESRRAQMAAHVEAQRQRQTYARAQRLRPGNTWRNLHAMGERGGKRPGLQAWPGQWSSYLLRLDSDGLDGNGWRSLLGLAYKRLEREQADRPLWQALQAYTDPRRDGRIQAVMAACHLHQTQAYARLDAAARRLYADLEALSSGRHREREERERRQTKGRRSRDA